MHFIEELDEENIDRQHLRPPVLAILLEIIEREILAGCTKFVNVSPIKNMLYGTRTPETIYVYIFTMRCVL